MKNPFSLLHERFPRIWALTVLPFFLVITLFIAPAAILWITMCETAESLKKSSASVGRELKAPWRGWMRSMVKGERRKKKQELSSS